MVIQKADREEIADRRNRNAEAMARQVDIAGLDSMSEDEIDELADRLVEEARAERDGS